MYRSAFHVCCVGIGGLAAAFMLLRCHTTASPDHAPSLSFQLDDAGCVREREGVPPCAGAASAGTSIGIATAPAGPAAVALAAVAGPCMGERGGRPGHGAARTGEPKSIPCCKPLIPKRKKLKTKFARVLCILCSFFLFRIAPPSLRLSLSLVVTLVVACAVPGLHIMIM
jgi:hypothetical protein